MTIKFLLWVTLSLPAVVYSFSIYPEESFAGETVTRVGRCYDDRTLVEIKFPTDPSALITVCHDETTDFTLWASHILYGPLLNQSESGTRPSFKEASFYPDIVADDCYKQVKQLETIGLLLGSTSLASQYIQPSRNLFLARGHLAPNGDPITVVQKAATFYFINASPQWQVINGGNWVALENNLRTIARNAQATLTVWTGSYGVTTLPNSAGQPTEIWLGRDSRNNLIRKLPVNHLTWKVIHDPATRTAVAIIQINNPYHTPTAEDILCDNVCSSLPWVNWNVSNVTLGYTYCCSVHTFHQAVPYAPDLGNLPLLRL